MSNSQTGNKRNLNFSKKRTLFTILVFFTTGAGLFLYGCAEGGDPRINIEDYPTQIANRLLVIIPNFILVTLSCLSVVFNRPRVEILLFLCMFILFYDLYYYAMMLEVILQCNRHVAVECVPKSDDKICVIPLFKQCINRNYPIERGVDSNYILSLHGIGVFLLFNFIVLKYIVFAEKEVQNIKTHQD